MSADARFLLFRRYVNLVAPEFRRLLGKGPIPWHQRTDMEEEAAQYARAVYKQKTARLRMKVEGHITEI